MSPPESFYQCKLYSSPIGPPGEVIYEEAAAKSGARIPNPTENTIIAKD